MDSRVGTGPCGGLLDARLVGGLLNESGIKKILWWNNILQTQGKSERTVIRLEFRNFRQVYILQENGGNSRTPPNELCCADRKKDQLLESLLYAHSTSAVLRTADRVGLSIKSRCQLKSLPERDSADSQFSSDPRSLGRIHKNLS